jgi:glycine/D-amino acid oxidase-like deaminating enzyme
MLKQIGNSDLLADICLVGTGPVGMTLALEFDRRGLDVLVLEAGDMEDKPSEAARADIADPARHAEMALAVSRALGGTSWRWGGRCVSYDDVDWLPRDFVADAEWPIDHDTVKPYYKSAAEYMLCGGAFEVPYEQTLSHGLTLHAVERWARMPRVILVHRERLLQSPRITLSLKSTVTGFDLSPDGRRVEALNVTTPQGVRKVRARRFILALGGVEVTRLLLHAQQSAPRLFGGIDGPLGRYYMGHISGKIANIVFDCPSYGNDLDFRLDETGVYYRRRFMLSADAQVRNKVLNTAFWPDNPSFCDPAHANGVLSAVFLLLAFPPTGRRLLPEGVRLAHIGPRPYPILAHLKNAILGAPSGTVDVYRILRDRFVCKPRKPGFLLESRGGKYALHYHAEQIPNAESRITLSQEKDSFGVPRACIDLRYTDGDVQSVINSHYLLDEALRANGIGRLEFKYAPETLASRVDAQATGGYHQVGATRMGTDPGTSVVDANLKTHSLENLYIASSSVFPTSGQANSTLLAVALALRLANHLAAVGAGTALIDQSPDCVAA